MRQAASVAGEASPPAVSLAPAPQSAQMPSFQPGAWTEDLPAKVRLHVHGSCPKSFLLGASCLKLRSSQGPQIYQGSVKSDTSPSVSLASYRGIGSAGVAWILKAGHTQSQLPMDSSRGLQCSLISWVTS